MLTSQTSAKIWESCGKDIKAYILMLEGLGLSDSSLICVLGGLATNNNSFGGAEVPDKSNSDKDLLTYSLGGLYTENIFSNRQEEREVKKFTLKLHKRLGLI